MRFSPAFRRTLALGITVAATILAACSEKSSGVDLLPSVTSPISDVPVPAGFTIDLSKSNSRVVPASQFRTVYHEYTGDDYLLQVVRFYRDQLPTKGWTMIDQNQIKDKITLRFNKGKEDCSVTVWKATFDTHIIINIGPAGGAAATAPRS